MTSIGRMRFLATFEDLQSDQDSNGRTVEEWVPALGGKRMYVSVEPISGRELLAAASIQSDVSTRIIMHWTEGVTTRMRVRIGATTYNIRSVIPDPHSGRQRLTLMCTSGTNEG